MRGRNKKRRNENRRDENRRDGKQFVIIRECYGISYDINTDSSKREADKDKLIERTKLTPECASIYIGNVVNGKFEDKEGVIETNQGTFKGEFRNGVMVSGKFCDSQDKILYSVSTPYENMVKIEYFLNGTPNLILNIRENKLDWKIPDGSSKEQIKNSINKLLSSFTGNEADYFDPILANLALFNTDENIIQYNNKSDFSQTDCSLTDQLDAFINFAKKTENNGKVVTSILYTNNHAVGVLYLNGECLVINTSRAFDDDSKKILEDNNFKILNRHIQGNKNNCVIASRLAINSYAKQISGKDIKQVETIEKWTTKDYIKDKLKIINDKTKKLEAKKAELQKLMDNKNHDLILKSITEVNKQKENLVKLTNKLTELKNKIKKLETKNEEVLKKCANSEQAIPTQEYSKQREIFADDRIVKECIEVADKYHNLLESGIYEKCIKDFEKEIQSLAQQSAEHFAAL